MLVLCKFPFPTLDHSHCWTLVVLVLEEHVRTKVTRHMNDEYELFSHVYTAKFVVSFVLHCAVAS